MEIFDSLNERVEVVAMYRQGDVRSGCMPVRMRYRGGEVTFRELGLRHPTTKGRRMIHVFDMSDGTHDYRLEFDAEGLTWTLTAIVEATT